MSKVKNALKELEKYGLKLEDAIEKTIYETEDGELIAFYDYDGEDMYKGIILFSKRNEVGDVNWYFLKGLKKAFVVE